jgi:NADH:ubiquinone oxidoreductase subunit 2 (subunit N)
MSDARWLLAVVVALPLMVIAVSFIRVDVERLRRLAVLSAAVMLLTTIVIAMSPALRAFSLRSSALTRVPEGEAILRIDALTDVLLPFAASLWLLTVAVTPRAALDRGGLRRTALATVVTLASFLTESAVILLLLSVAAVFTFLTALSDAEYRYQRRIVAAYLGFSTVMFAAGVVLLVGPGADHPAIEVAGMWLIIIAALARKGIFPFHAWVPEVFDHGRLGPAILFCAPQLGAYITVVLIVPRASPAMLRTVAVLALGTAVYGAALALAQTSARRACGYLFVSQSALVMAGLDCTSAGALAGGLLVWLSAGWAFAGLARSVLVLEARRGPDEISRRVRPHAGAGHQLPVHGPRVHRIPWHSRVRRPGTAGRRRGRRVSGDGIRGGHCIRAHGSCRHPDVLLAVLWPHRCADTFQLAPRSEAAGSVDVRGAGYRPYRVRHHPAATRRFTPRCKQRHPPAPRGTTVKDAIGREQRGKVPDSRCRVSRACPDFSRIDSSRREPPRRK